jgi:predicted phosphodiesterase
MTLILFVGDAHGNMPYMNHVFNVAKNAEVDLVIQVGDFGFWPDSQFARKIYKRFKQGGLPLWVIEGNHDWPVEAAQFTQEPRLEPGLRHIARGTTWTVDGIKFGFMGGAVSVDQKQRVIGRSWWPEEVVSESDVERAISNGPVDVWVTHDSVDLPPGKKRWQFGHRVDLAVSIQADYMRQIFDTLKPRLHIHGHHHYRYSAPTEYGTVVGLDCENGDGLFMIDTERLPS